MCDYSLHNAKSRKAAVGDEVVTDHPTFGSGLALTDIHDPSCAICLMEGVGVEFDRPITFVAPDWNQTGYRTARYVHFNSYNGANYRRCSMLRVSPAYRDWLQLPDGSTYPIASLREGQTGRVAVVPPKKVEDTPTLLQRVADVVS